MKIQNQMQAIVASINFYVLTPERRSKQKCKKTIPKITALIKVSFEYPKSDVAQLNVKPSLIKPRKGGSKCSKINWFYKIL
jgi:predicted metal-dependent RNase